MAELATSSGNEIQLKFFNKIRDIIPSNISLVDELADLLELSNDSVYRRIRCETSLTIEEIAKISEHFNISFDIFSVKDSSTVTFNYGFLRNEEGFKDYLLSILNDMKKFDQSQDEEKQIIYSANDIPLFWHFNFYELTTFKIFYWLKSILDISGLQNQKFSVSIIDKELINIAKDIYQIYSTLPSIEIWTDDTITSHLKHIEFYWDAGYFENKKDALLICHQAKQEMENLQLQVENSSKMSNDSPVKENNFKFYMSEIEIGNNTILMKMGNSRKVYLGFHTFNKIATSNPRFCEETEKWLDNIIKKSMLISGASSKYRYKFFKKMFEKFDTLRNKIENS